MLVVASLCSAGTLARWLCLIATSRLLVLFSLPFPNKKARNRLAVAILDNTRAFIKLFYAVATDNLIILFFNSSSRCFSSITPKKMPILPIRYNQGCCVGSACSIFCGSCTVTCCPRLFCRLGAVLPFLCARNLQNNQRIHQGCVEIN